MIELCCECLSAWCIWLNKFQSESTLYSLPECQGTSCSKQAPYIWSLSDSNGIRNSNGTVTATGFSWWFSWFFRIINVNQWLFTLNVLFDEVDRELEHEKKHFVRCIPFIAFFNKTSYGRLKLMTCSYTCRE